MAETPELKGQYRLHTMDKVIFGRGTLGQLDIEVERLGKRRAMIVTANTLATTTDLVDRVKAALHGKCVGVFQHTPQHVQRPNVLEGAERARDCNADILIGFGGSSVGVYIKHIALCMAENIRTAEELDAYKTVVNYPNPPRPGKPVRGTAPPGIAIPTTLSGGEFTSGGSITNEVTHLKEPYGDPQLMPKVVILDPELSVATPNWLWGSTGMKAMDHCVEIVYSPLCQPVVEAMALQAASMLSTYLPMSVRHPDDINARGQCLVAAWLAIFGLTNGSVGLSHAIGHQLGATRNVPHGYTSCVVLPHAMEFNRPASAARQALIARTLGVETRGLSDEAAAEAAQRAVEAMIEGMGLPRHLRDVGVRREDFEMIAAAVLKDGSVANNPRRVEGAQDVIGVLERAW